MGGLLGSLQEISLRLILALHAFSNTLDGLCMLFVLIGAVVLFIMLIPILYWAIDKRIALNVFLGVIFTTLICLAIKPVAHQMRPYWSGIAQTIFTIPSYAAPSIYAADTMVLLGYLAYRYKKGWIWACSGIYFTLSGISLVYLGLQFPVGVLSGWLIGLMVVIGLLRVVRIPLPALKSLPISIHIAILFSISILIALAGTGVTYLTRAIHPEAAWIDTLLNWNWEENFFQAAGAFFGCAGGYVAMKKYLDIQVRCKFSTKVYRILLGFSGLVVIYFSINGVIAGYLNPGTMLNYVLRYLQACLSASWIFLGAPWLFLRINLARPAPARLMMSK